MSPNLSVSNVMLLLKPILSLTLRVGTILLEPTMKFVSSVVTGVFDALLSTLSQVHNPFERRVAIEYVPDESGLKEGFSTSFSIRITIRYDVR